MAASAYADAETTLDLQDAVLTIDVDATAPLLGGIDRDAHQHWRNGDYRGPGEGSTAGSTTNSKGSANE